VTRSTTVEVPLRTHGHVDGLHHALAVMPPVSSVEDVEVRLHLMLPPARRGHRHRTSLDVGR
jgi:hypothetical protein